MLSKTRQSASLLRGSTPPVVRPACSATRTAQRGLVSLRTKRHAGALAFTERPCDRSVGAPLCSVFKDPVPAGTQRTAGLGERATHRLGLGGSDVPAPDDAVGLSVFARRATLTTAHRFRCHRRRTCAERTPEALWKYTRPRSSVNLRAIVSRHGSEVRAKLAFRASV